MRAASVVLRPGLVKLYIISGRFFVGIRVIALKHLSPRPS
jgi:hypothetical protein